MFQFSCKQQAHTLNFPLCSGPMPALCDRHHPHFGEGKTDTHKGSNTIFQMSAAVPVTVPPMIVLPRDTAFWDKVCLIAGTSLKMVWKGHDKLYPVAARSGVCSRLVAPWWSGIRAKTPGKDIGSKPLFTSGPGSSHLSDGTQSKAEMQSFPHAGRSSVPQREGQCDLVTMVRHTVTHPTCSCCALSMDSILWWAFRIYKSIKQCSCPQWAHRSERPEPWGQMISRDQGKGKAGIVQPPRMQAKGKMHRWAVHHGILHGHYRVHCLLQSLPLGTFCLADPEENYSLEANSAFQP